MKQKIKREFSAGGIVFRKEPEGVLWLVTKPKGSDKWRFPKGGIEKKESSAQAAQREVEEEGGVETNLLDKIGHKSFFFFLNKQRIFKTVTFYLMEYTGEAKSELSWEVEAIDWLPFKEAKERLAFENEKELLEKANQIKLTQGEVA